MRKISFLYTDNKKMIDFNRNDSLLVNNIYNEYKINTFIHNCKYSNQKQNNLVV